MTTNALLITIGIFIGVFIYVGFAYYIKENLGVWGLPVALVPIFFGGWWLLSYTEKL